MVLIRLYCTIILTKILIVLFFKNILLKDAKEQTEGNT